VDTAINKDPVSFSFAIQAGISTSHQASLAVIMSGPGLPLRKILLDIVTKEELSARQPLTELV
jgi:hypothetical protein